MMNQFGHMIMMPGTPIMQGTGSPGSFFFHQMPTSLQAGGPTPLGASVQTASTARQVQAVNLKPSSKESSMPSEAAPQMKSAKKAGPGRKLAQDRDWPAEWLDIPCVQFNRFIKNSNMTSEQISELKRAR